MKTMRTMLLLSGLALLAAGPGRAADESAVSPPANAHRWLTDRPDYSPDLTYPIFYTLTIEAVGIAWLNLRDNEETGFDRPRGSRFLDGFRKGPRVDTDEWYWNYAAHPLWGSETYLRTRSQGCNPLGSFLFSAVASTVWEYGFEGWSQRPSSQDLIVTPVTGALIGEARFHAKRALLEEDTRTSRTLAVVIDPLQSLAEVIGDAFGQDWREPAFRKEPAGTAFSVPPLSLALAFNGDGPVLLLDWHGRF